MTTSNKAIKLKLRPLKTPLFTCPVGAPNFSKTLMLLGRALGINGGFGLRLVDFWWSSFSEWAANLWAALNALKSHPALRVDESGVKIGAAARRVEAASIWAVAETYSAGNWLENDSLRPSSDFRGSLGISRWYPCWSDSPSSSFAGLAAIGRCASFDWSRGWRSNAAVALANCLTRAGRNDILIVLFLEAAGQTHGTWCVLTSKSHLLNPWKKKTTSFLPVVFMLLVKTFEIKPDSLSNTNAVVCFRFLVQ